MSDQAERLRLRLRLEEKKNNKKAIAVVSGKGGVGKSNFSLNFAITLSKWGAKALLIDMDIGMGNLDILMGSAPDLTIVDYFEKEIPLEKIMLKGPNGVRYIAGGSGLASFVKLGEAELDQFFEDLEMNFEDYDYLIFDMGAGIREDLLPFLLSVDEVFVVTTPEPTAITDAYAMMKYVHLLNSRIPLYVVVNKARSIKEGTETIQRLSKVVDQFLGRRLISLGILPDDLTVQTAVRRQIPFVNINEKSPVSRSLIEIADRYVQRKPVESTPAVKFHFVSKLKKILFKGRGRYGEN
ncbi:cobyrinic acid ac-diamide synthase [Bacillus methanolicus PB1]|uniref:Cobyrinic acid ac-diamide synthase n=1 Tax=Bacillus methanolicus PB1 TaxID=997296 RepID=I3E4R0_BACMT|nr:MinD/ParA family protein [Bacillus methanolicus]EIJ81481.1 cobyrinic acid ac-diamide synthase [Bacillus methanolicus PB1]